MRDSAQPTRNTIHHLLFVAKVLQKVNVQNKLVEKCYLDLLLYDNVITNDEIETMSSRAALSD